MERKRCADSGDLKRCMRLSRCRTRRCEISVRLFRRPPVTCRRLAPSRRKAAPWEGSLSVIQLSGATPCFFSSLRISLHDDVEQPKPARRALDSAGPASRRETIENAIDFRAERLREAVNFEYVEYQGNYFPFMAILFPIDNAEISTGPFALIILIFTFDRTFALFSCERTAVTDASWPL